MFKPLTALLCCLFCAATSYAQSPAGPSLPRSTPESQGVATAAIHKFIETAHQQLDSLHSFMLIRHGQVVAECWWFPYDATTRHQLYSLSKSFTSTAVGLAISEGKLNLDDPVSSFFPDDMPKDASSQLKAMRVRDLLMMSTGHETEPKVFGEPNWSKVFLDHPVKFKPGTHFLYNTPATYMCSAIVQRQTGQTVLEFLKPRLFEPLGIVDPVWGTSPQGVTLGGYGLFIRTEDIAKFGQLLLQRGQWKGQQVVPAEWIDQATARQTSNGSSPTSDWDQGYGFQFWRCRHGAYRGDGAFGQYCVVLPEQDAVIAITSGLGNMQAVLDLAWDTLLPGFYDRPLAENIEAQQSLQVLTADLKLSLAQGSASSAAVVRLAGKELKFQPNDFGLVSLTLSGDAEQSSLIVDIEGSSYTIPVGQPQWARASIARSGEPNTQVATSSAWTNADTCELKIALVETPFVVTSKLKFSDSAVTVETKANVAFGPTQQPQLQGQLSQ